ncbi:hypothetical protein WDK74_22085 [Escherichia coli]
MGDTQPGKPLAPWEMNEAEYAVWEASPDASPHSDAWHKDRFEPFIQLALAHALQILADDWEDIREEARETSPDEWLPFLPDYSEQEIDDMTREQVIRESGVWHGISADDYPGLFTGGEKLGELRGNPVVFSAKHGAYFWNEPERDELCTISLRHPAELRLYPTITL